jgi:hypothetical protein
MNSIRGFSCNFCCFGKENGRQINWQQTCSKNKFIYLSH